MKNWFMSQEIKSILLLPIISTNRINIWCGRCHCKACVAYRFSHKPQKAQFIIIKKAFKHQWQEVWEIHAKNSDSNKICQTFFSFSFFFSVCVASKSWQVSNINKFKIKFILFLLIFQREYLKLMSWEYFT